MKIKIEMPRERYDRLKMDSQMLGQIAAHVERFAHTPKTTTLECVISMDARLKAMTKQVRSLKLELKTK